MSGPRLFGKDGSRQFCSSQLRSKADLLLIAVRRCLDLGLLVAWLIVSPLLILASGLAIMFYAVPAFKDLVLPFMGEPVKATVIYRKVQKGVNDEGSADSYEIVYGYKFNEHGRQVDGVSSEYVYRQTYERLAINEPVFVRCLNSSPSFFSEIKNGQALPEVGPYFYQPTVVTDIGKDVLMRCDEVFGPVVGIYGYDDIEEAIDMANDSDYGLNASIIGNRKEAIRISHFIEAGGVNINEGYRATFASFGAPMGGFKLSGVGRRSGVGGLLRYTEARTVGVAKTLLGIGLPLNARGWKRMAPLMDLLAKIQRRLP